MPALHLDHLEVPCTEADLHAIRTGRTDVLERAIVAALRSVLTEKAEVRGDRPH